MNKVFVQTFLGFLAAFLLLIAIQFLLITMGLNRSIDSWDMEKREHINQNIYRFLQENSGTAMNPMRQGLARNRMLVEHNFPLIILDAEKEVLFRNELAEHLENEPKIAEFSQMHDGRRLLGFYYSGNIRFRDDTANIALLETFEDILLLHFFLAIVIALLFSFLLSRQISNAILTISHGLRRLSKGDLSFRLKLRGPAEIQSLVASANSLASDLQNESALRKQWARDIAHDLRTPIAALRAQFEAMLDGVLSIEKDRIRKNLQEIQRTEQLVMSLNLLMSLEAPEHSLELSRFTDSDIASELETQFDSFFQEKNLHFIKDCKDIEIHADKTLLFRAVQNILHNSFRHTQNGGTIRLNFETDSAYIFIKVWNDGEPLQEGEEKLVFDRLYRGEYARTSEGAGLGLSIAKSIVELHDGYISMSSHKEKGTETLIKIPKRKEL